MHMYLWTEWNDESNQSFSYIENFHIVNKTEIEIETDVKEKEREEKNKTEQW